MSFEVSKLSINQIKSISSSTVFERCDKFDIEIVSFNSFYSRDLKWKVSTSHNNLSFYSNSTFNNEKKISSSMLEDIKTFQVPLSWVVEFLKHFYRRFLMRELMWEWENERFTQGYLDFYFKNWILESEPSIFHLNICGKCIKTNILILLFITKA